MTSAFSWQNSISLCPASFRIPRPNLPVTLGVSWWRGLTECSPLDKGMANHFGILEEAEVEWFYEDLQDLLELTPQKMSFSL